MPNDSTPDFDATSRARHLPWERAILVLSAVLLVAFIPLVMQMGERFDPLPVRLGLAGFALLGAVSSYGSTWIARHLRLWVTVTGYLMLLWVQVLGTANGLPIANAVTGALVILIVPSFAHRWTEVAAFAVVVGIITSISHSFVPEPGIPLTVSVLLYVSIIVGLGGFTLSRVRLEDALDKANATLEARVSARTRELASANARLRDEIAVRQRAERTALSANEAKSTFLANMSHELRTPLNAVLGYTELLEDEIDEPQAVEDLQRIHSAASHLLRTIQGILDLTKIESNALILDTEAVDVDALLTTVVEATKAEFSTHGNMVALTPIRSMASADEERLRQVFSHVLSNALKFTENGTVQIAGSTVDGRVRVWIADTGVGMSATFLARAMETFEMADASSTRVTGGSGLGLSLANGLVEAMGGTLTIQSAEGEGTTVFVELPAAT